ncbi:hypothetical protein AAFC00_007033 [Neodothiora populina]|uniref:Arf-GAP domain-containing protein n=1 Tax=Neodothiora populina TaxID=2781224 RepID=A0ABR3PCG2_9PEZI
MAGLMSKRQQARNEKVLQELLRTVPGNDKCADCATKNPGWASWSLGIFLCMTCAALHRKMGTHISKVKSLSMDSWSSDQVDNMKKVGNVVSNLKYNPQNVKPDIPFDADEVGGAMERFIRRKYETLEFATTSARRGAANHTGNASTSSAEDQPPPLPPKPGKKFGLALRSASATFTRPRMDKYTPPMSPAYSGSDGRESPPRTNKQSRVFGSTIGNMHDDAFKAKMSSLREMGFHDAEQNAFVLKEMNGNLSATVEGLVRLGGGNRPGSRNITPVSASSGALNGLNVDRVRASEIPPKAPPKDPVDPFAALDNETQPQRRAATMPLPQLQQQQQSYNPFLPAHPQLPPQQTLQDSFAGMQISSQPQHYANTPPPQQAQNPYNPFMAPTQQAQMQAPQHPQQQPQYQYPQPLQPQHTAQPLQPQHTSNPFLRATKSQTFTHTQSNPFFQQPALPQNPWLNQPQVQTPQAQTPSYQGSGQADFFSSQPIQQQQQQPPPQFQSQAQYQPNGQMQPPSSYMLNGASNPFQGQNTIQQPQRPQTQPLPQPTQSFNNPYQSSQQPPQQMQQPQPQQQLQQQPFQQQQQQQVQQQQVQQQPQYLQSRHDKQSILQLYSYPQLAPARSLQALPEETAMPPQQAQQALAAANTPGRSVTMPTTGSMNPFMSGNAAAAVQTAQQSSQAPAQNIYNHSSRDSMAFVGLGSGRQSPDAFASLSSQYGR